MNRSAIRTTIHPLCALCALNLKYTRADDITMTHPLNLPEFSSIPDALAFQAAQHPERGIDCYDVAGVKNFISYPHLLDSSRRIARSLNAQGFQPGDRLLMIVPNSIEFVQIFFACLHIGVLPIPLAPPRTISSPSLSSYAGSLQRLAWRLQSRHLILPPQYADNLIPILTIGRDFDWIETTTKLLASKPASDTVESSFTPSPHDPAFIQLSSGTTGPAQGAILSHHGILFNVLSIGRQLQVTHDDIGVSWLPFFHAMGLIGVLLFSIVHGLPLVLLDPERFMHTPHEWLWIIANHRATLTAAPDFGFHYCTRRSQRSDLDGLDLSSLRVAMCGGEPIHTIHALSFQRRFKPYNLQPNTIVPVYGLGEASLAVTSHLPSKPLQIAYVQREALERKSILIPSQPDDPTAINLVSVGFPLRDTQITIQPTQLPENPSLETALPHNTLGVVHVKSPCLMLGYSNTSAPSQPSSPDDWINTGDLGALDEKGRLFLLGHASDVIRLQDRTIHPELLEALIARIDGLRNGAVAAFGVPFSALSRHRNPHLRSVADNANISTPTSASALHDNAHLTSHQLLILAVEVSEGLDLDRLQIAIKDVFTEHVQTQPNDIQLLSPNSLPKTRSGKVQRYKCQRLYLDGTLDRRDRQERWKTITNFTDRARTAVAQLGRRLRTFFE